MVDETRESDNRVMPGRDAEEAHRSGMDTQKSPPERSRDKCLEVVNELEKIREELADFPL